MRYEVCCDVCYSFVVARCATKKDANIRATNHLNAYGHNVFINDTKANGVYQARKD